jgi:hypothetical protein
LLDDGRVKNLIQENLRKEILMTQLNTSTMKGQFIRFCTAVALAGGFSAVLLSQAYAQETQPTAQPTTQPTTQATNQPLIQPTTQPVAGTTPVTLSATKETTTFTCEPATCNHATITAYLSGTPATAFTTVQWRDTAGVWHDVEGWQAAPDMIQGSGVPFVQWAVLPEQFGDGPFRWVIYTKQGGDIWGISPTFNLPTVAARNEAMYLTEPGKAFIKPMLGNPVVPDNAPVLSADGGTTAFGCEGLCDHSNITAYVPNAPASAWMSVQWLDSAGIWHDVEGWQGNLDIASGSNMPFKQWSVFVNQYNQGPFRWVVYDQRGGNVWGISPSFNLPKWGGLGVTTFLRPNTTTTATNAT